MAARDKRARFVDIVQRDGIAAGDFLIVAFRVENESRSCIVINAEMARYIVIPGYINRAKFYHPVHWEVIQTLQCRKLGFSFAYSARRRRSAY